MEEAGSPVTQERVVHDRRAVAWVPAGAACDSSERRRDVPRLEQRRRSRSLLRAPLRRPASVTSAATGGVRRAEAPRDTGKGKREKAKRAKPTYPREGSEPALLRRRRRAQRGSHANGAGRRGPASE